MDQRGGLQRLAGPLACHLRRREPAQFSIDEREQFILRSGLANVNPME